MKFSFYYSAMIIAVICFCMSLYVISICVLIIQHYMFRYIQYTYSLHTQYRIFYNLCSLYKRNYFPVSLISALLNNRILMLPWTYLFWNTVSSFSPHITVAHSLLSFTGCIIIETLDRTDVCWWRMIHSYLN